MYIYDNITVNSFQHEKCFRKKLYGKSQHTFHVNNFLFQKSCHLLDNVDKYGTVRPATIRCIMQRWIIKAADAHSEYVPGVLPAIARQQLIANALPLYVICTLPVTLHPAPRSPKLYLPFRFSDYVWMCIETDADFVFPCTGRC
jgi:hypothetical protein